MTRLLGGRPAASLLVVALAAVLVAACARGAPRSTDGAGPMGPGDSMSIAQAPRGGTVPASPPPRSAVRDVSTSDPLSPQPAPEVRGPTTAPVATPAAATSANVDDALRFRFQVGDEVEVSVWGETDLTLQHRILRDGTVPAKVIGNVQVAGRTIDDVNGELARRYAEFLVDPRPSIRVLSVFSDRIFVLGEVKDPAAVPLGGPMTVMQAIAQAGGFLEGQASKSTIRVVRPGPDLSQTPQLISVNGALLLAGRGQNTLLQPGDIVYVHPNSTYRWARDLNIALQPVVTALNGIGSIATAVLAFDRPR